MNRIKLWFALLAIVAVIPQPAHTQTRYASITGSVTDTSGAVLGGATVTIVDATTNIARSTVTDKSGEYTLPLLQPGTYDIRAEAPQFEQTVRRGIVLQVDQKARADFSLQVGTAKNVVEVNGGETLTETESSEVGTVIDNRKVTELPLNQRQFYSLALLAPGAYPPGQNSTNSPRGGFNVVGMPETANNFSVNGGQWYR